MAREAGELKCDCCLPYYGETDIEGFEGFLKRFAELVRADERSGAEERFNALLDDYCTALETIGDMRSEDEVNGSIIECHEATIKRLEAKILAEREALIGLLKGIDETETESAEGWWETSAGAEFGAGILAAIRARWQA
jgi:hypothetical protein